MRQLDYELLRAVVAEIKDCGLNCTADISFGSATVYHRGCTLMYISVYNNAIHYNIVWTKNGVIPLEDPTGMSRLLSELRSAVNKESDMETDAFTSCKKLLVELHQAMKSYGGDSPEAEVIRDNMDLFWSKLSKSEEEELANLSEQLYNEEN